MLSLKRTRQALPYVTRIFELLNLCYADLYGMVPLSPAMIQQYKDRFFGFVNPDYLSIIVDPVSYTHLDVYKRQVLNYEVISEAIMRVRCGRAISDDWKERIDEDFKKRGGRK